MGANVNHKVTTGLAWVIAGLVIALNLALIWLTVTGS
jgi:manganese transport protein